MSIEECCQHAGSPPHAHLCVGACRNNFLPAERALGAASTAPVYVILSDGRGGSPQNSPPQYRIEQLPNGFTTGELADQLSQSSSDAGGHLRMLVSCPVCSQHSALLLRVLCYYNGRCVSGHALITPLVQSCPVVPACFLADLQS